MAHRRKFGGGRGEAVAKAVGIKGDYPPDVVDANCRAGRDAFVLASVGCRVRMLERNPVVAALLSMMARRGGYADPEIGPWLQERLQLIHASSLTALTDITPRRRWWPRSDVSTQAESALVKKRCGCFSHWVGPDLDADGLLEPASVGHQTCGGKRPDYAPAAGGCRHAERGCDEKGICRSVRSDIYAGTA